MGLLLVRTQAFYSEFQWVARVSVSPCAPEISRHRAHTAVQKALDVFKLLVGGGRAANVKQAYDLSAPQRYYELVSASPGSFGVRSGGKMLDAVVNDQWYEQVTGLPEWSLLESVLSDQWNHWEHVDELESRFLDALGWHSDAISEPDPGAQIIKYWVAIERLFSISARDSFVTRLAVLSADGLDAFEEELRKLSKLYQKRSEVVHGGARRTREFRHRVAARACEQASRFALIQFLRAIPHVRRRYGSGDWKCLRAWLLEVDNMVKLTRREIALRQREMMQPGRAPS